MAARRFDGYDCTREEKKKPSRLVHGGPQTMSAKTKETKKVTAAVSAPQAVNGGRDLLFHLPHCSKDKFPPHLVKMKRTSESKAPHFRKM